MNKLWKMLLCGTLCLTACAGKGGSAEGSQESEPEDPVILPSEGYAEGYIGDTLRVMWFDFTVNKATRADTYKGITPLADGEDLVIVNLTIHNTSRSSVPMVDYDFSLDWGSEDDAFAYPVTAYDEELTADGMFEAEYSVGINETMTGDLVFSVPEDKIDFRLYFEEYFEDETTGDAFGVLFTAK